jgi:ArsR family transcriptional regulator
MPVRWKAKAEPTEWNERVLAGLAKAVGHPVRVHILRTLLSRRVCTCRELVEVLPLAQATVSQHLKVLREAGLVTCEADGTSRCYRVNTGALARLKNAVDALAGTAAARGFG